MDDSGEKVVALLDFGDLSCTFRVAEVSIALTYAMLLAMKLRNAVGAESGCIGKEARITRNHDIADVDPRESIALESEAGKENAADGVHQEHDQDREPIEAAFKAGKQLLVSQVCCTRCAHYVHLIA